MMLNLTRIMSAHQDEEWDPHGINKICMWKGSHLAPKTIFEEIRLQYLFWKHVWSNYGEERQLQERLPTFGFHLMALLTAAMNTYWFSSDQHLCLFNWMNDMVSQAERDSLDKEIAQARYDNITHKARTYELELQIERARSARGQPLGSWGILCVALIGLVVGHILAMYS